MMKTGDTFKLTDDAVNHYGDEHRDKEFTVSHVATSKDNHPGYDESAEGMALYDAEELDFSVYEYEVIPIDSKSEEMRKLLMGYGSYNDLVDMVAHLRKYLNPELLSNQLQYDVVGELVAGPEHVIYHVASYIELLENKIQMNRNALSGFSTKEGELVESILEKSEEGIKEYNPDDIGELINMVIRMKNSLRRIRWNPGTNPQAMIMISEAQRGLYGRKQ